MTQEGATFHVQNGNFPADFESFSLGAHELTLEPGWMRGTSMQGSRPSTKLSKVP